MTRPCANTKRRGWQGALLVLAFFAGRGAAEELSFTDALDRMKTANETLLAADEDIRQRKAERAAAWGLRAPKAEIDLRHVRLNAPITIGISVLDQVDLGVGVQSDHFWEGQLGVTLPLYAGGRISAATHAAKARQDEAHAQRRVSEAQLATTLAERYFGLRLAGQARAVQELNVAAMDQHVHRARRLAEEGIIARVEYLNAEVALANARRELSAAERDVAIIEEAVANIIVAEGSIEPTSHLFLIRDLEACEIFQDYVDQAHPVLQVIESQQDLTRQGTRAEKGELKPQMYAFGMHELVPDDLTVLDPEWAVGVGVHYTLFDGLRSWKKVKAAKAQERKVAYLAHKYQRDLRSLALKRYEETQKAIEQYDALEATLRLTGENRRARARAFEEGLTTSLEVVDATLSHARAQLGRIKAAYDFDLAFFQLLEACGQTDRCREYLGRAAPIPEYEAREEPGPLPSTAPAPQPVSESEEPPHDAPFMP